MRSDQIGCHRPSVPYYSFSFIHTSPPTSITPCIKVASVITFTIFSYKPYYGVLSLQPRLLFSPFSTPFLFGWFTNGSHIIESSLKHFSAQYTSTTLSRTLNPTIYNIVCWFAGSLGQITRQPSIILFLILRHSKLFIFVNL